jgi:GDP-L-fucose synthase
MKPTDKIYVAGHRGLVGSAIVQALNSRGFTNLVTATSNELDLRDQRAVNSFFLANKPDVVFLAAARVGGILANSTYPGQFLYDNVMIGSNVVEAARVHGVRKLVNLGSSCIYPKFAPQPIPETALLSGPLEETNRAYALAKIATLEMCDHYRKQYGCDFVSGMPCNLYGPGDNFDLKGSHVIPALMRKAFEAKHAKADSMEVWGSGTPLREFLYVEDLAEACLFLAETYSDYGPVNIGTGDEVTIRELAEAVCTTVGFEGELKFDATKPDGTPRKVLDVSRLENAGWKAKVPLGEGLKRTFEWFQQHVLVGDYRH